MERLFKTKRLGPGRKREATAVVCNHFTQDGIYVLEYNEDKGKMFKDEVIVTIFGGSDRGKSEAERLCKMLNFTYEVFHNGGYITHKRGMDTLASCGG